MTKLESNVMYMQILKSNVMFSLMYNKLNMYVRVLEETT